MDHRIINYLSLVKVIRIFLVVSAMFSLKLGAIADFRGYQFEF